jgi:hypothetical protein
MVKVINKGVAKLGERGQSSGAIITGANLRRPPEKKPPPATPAKAARPAPSKAAKRRSR